MHEVTILGIESSCDDTSAAVYKNGKILANVIANQSIHEEYGGVVPEMASRAHQEMIIPVVDKALKLAGVDRQDVDAVACTRGPGLLGSLLVGMNFAKSFCMALDIPLVEVHHMHAHILAHFIEEPRPSFPFLCLTVSGGHTQIVRVDGHLDMTVIGHTLDDAAGEAFDKIAKLFGLKYPGGPLIDRHARNGDPNRFTFPEPRIEGLNYSFSGVKTAVRYFIDREVTRDSEFVKNNLEDLCASIQKRIVTILMSKLKRAARETGISQIAIAGGVSANSGLREALQQAGERFGWEVYKPRFEYCLDNAAMIAMAGYYRYIDNRFAALSLQPDPRLAF